MIPRHLCFTLRRTSILVFVGACLIASGPARSQVVDSLVAKVSLSNLNGHIQSLQSAGGHKSRVTYTPGNDSAADYILRTFQSMPGLDAVEPDTFYVAVANAPYNTQPLRNIVAVLTGAVEPQKQIVIGAHYDCSASRMGTSTWNAEWNTIAAPGADDNASGVAVVLELARILSDPSSGYEPEYSIVFIAFAAEESVPPYAGKISHPGSKHYAAAANIRGDQIAGMISVDMIGYNTVMNYASIVSNDVSQSLGASVTTEIFKFGIPLTTNSAPFASATFSDHVEFWTNGYPAICLIEHNPPWNSSAYYSANPFYHTSADSLTTLNMNQVRMVGQATLAAVIAQAGVFVTSTSGDPSSDTPDRFVLSQNFPNPFNPTTEISYGLPLAAHVMLNVFDIHGRLIAPLVDAKQAAGSHRTTWKADNIASGIYLCRMEVTGDDGKRWMDIKRMVYLR